MDGFLEMGWKQSIGFPSQIKGTVDMRKDRSRLGRSMESAFADGRPATCAGKSHSAGTFTVAASGAENGALYFRGILDAFSLARE
jgi:hypothetical protein